MPSPAHRLGSPYHSPASGEGISPSSFDRLRTGSAPSPARLLKSYGEQVKGEEYEREEIVTLGLPWAMEILRLRLRMTRGKGLATTNRNVVRGFSPVPGLGLHDLKRSHYRRVGSSGGEIATPST